MCNPVQYRDFKFGEPTNYTKESNIIKYFIGNIIILILMVILITSWLVIDCCLQFHQDLRTVFSLNNEYLLINDRFKRNT